MESLAVGYYDFMNQSTRYRIYVDESGDEVMAPEKWRNPEARYLGLTGVVIESETYRTRTHPEFEALKQQFFPFDPDEPLVLVRQNIIQKRDYFRVLQNQEAAAQWEARVLRFFDTHIRQIITVVLDKKAYLQSDLQKNQRPYGHCIKALVDMYAQWLNRVEGTGDVMAETRVKKEDQELKDDFHRYITENINPLGTQEAQLLITSNQIKLNLKSRNITGLQLADLLAYPSMRGVLQENEHILGNPPSDTTHRFFEVIRSKSRVTRVLLP